MPATHTLAIAGSKLTLACQRFSSGLPTPVIACSFQNLDQYRVHSLNRSCCVGNRTILIE